MSTTTRNLETEARRLGSLATGRFTGGERQLLDVLKMYRPGGEWERRPLASYGMGKRRSMGAGLQHLVRSGLFSSTMPQTLSNAYERTVGNQWRLGMLGGLAGAKGNLASYYGQGSASAQGASASLWNAYMQAAMMNESLDSGLHGADWEKMLVGGGMKLAASPTGMGMLSGGLSMLGGGFGGLLNLFGGSKDIQRPSPYVGSPGSRWQ